MSAKHRIELPTQVRAHLEQVIRTGSHHARTILHARILLLADEADAGPAWSDEQIADALESSIPTVERIRRRFVKDGLEAALRVRKQVPGRPPKIDGAAEAHLVALACSSPPEGHARWTVRLLTDRFAELRVTEEPVSRETVRQTLKKTSFNPTDGSSG